MSEKKSLLDSLYDGEIFPAEDIVPQSDEYKEAVDKQSRIQSRLESKLPEKHHALLERFVAAIECTHTRGSALGSGSCWKRSAAGTNNCA